ncbi:MAG: sugar ABC transporter substrate-binding protein, partial [Bullifex sp.]|nr:sugar ABC transporter substrate-binding protein [Bullifex sp.]
MNFKRVLIALLTVLVLFSGCSNKKENTNEIKLDSNNPVSLTIWHYYNGAQQAAFDELLQEFNATIGKQKGIYVEGYSQGSVTDLEKALSDSV